MQKRQRIKQALSLADRLAGFANEAREKASSLPPGTVEDELLKKVRQAETALRVECWSASESAPLRPDETHHPQRTRPS
jgi:hypothetical protein